MKTIHKLIPLLLIIGMGCITNTEDLIIDDDGGETPTETVSYATTVQPILVDKGCIGCHSSGPLNFSSYSSLINSVGSNYGSQIVVAGDADASGLVDKIEPNPQSGSRMPTTGDYLSTTQIQNIRNWINQGAQNN